MCIICKLVFDMTKICSSKEFSSKVAFTLFICIYCIIGTDTAPVPAPAAPPPQKPPSGRVTAVVTREERNRQSTTKKPLKLFEYYYGKLSESLATPCKFPTPSEDDWKKCSVEPKTARKYNICDPESTTYFSKMDPLLKILDDIQTKRGDQCVCANASGPKCWYKFAFAFVEELKFPDLPINDLDKDELCNFNITMSGPPSIKSSDAIWQTRQAVMNYGNRFAELLRKRWNAGSCGEDILILIVTKAPSAPISHWNEAQKPIFFVSYGDTVKSRTEHITRPLNFQIKSMLEAVELANDMLQGTGENSTLEKALVILVTWYEQLLNLADQTYNKFNPRGRIKSHIPPNWALGAFAGCAVLLAIMGIGSGLARSGVRRGGMRAKQGGDPNRRWKAGFVGGMFLKRPPAQDNAGGRNGEFDSRSMMHRPSVYVSYDMTHMN